METRFNKEVQGPKRRRLLREGWQERLPVKPILYGFFIVLALSFLLSSWQPQSTYLGSAEVAQIRANGVLRVGLDENLPGLNRDGIGLEADLARALSNVLFEDPETVQLVPVTRQTIRWLFADGRIDMAFISKTSLSGSAYIASERPFYTDPCVLLCYDPARELAEARIGVLANTEAESLLIAFESEVEPEILILPYAAYYDMMVALRAGTLDALCLPRLQAMRMGDPGLQLHETEIGKIEYHAVARAQNRTLLRLVDELLLLWTRDGTLREYYMTHGLT
ncbi:MAG: transporter substrate-binding domain-containing protein [Clostridiales bacterium]|nr:transporter substrate-binding domain-containing protein [Clostridiales bacterium]